MVLTTIVVQSCNIKCDSEDQNTGYIHRYVNELEGFYVLNLNDGVVINGDSTFNVYFPYGFSVDPIDFSEFTLLGLYMEGSGCSNRMVRTVNKFENENRFHYKVTYLTCGICKPLRMYCNWVLIPKIPDGWHVTFQKEFG